MAGRRQVRWLAGAAVLGIVLVGCGAASTQPTSAHVTPSPTAASTVAPSGPLPLTSGALAPGQYTTTTFEPTLRFALVEDGWRGMFPDDEDEVALEGPDGAFFAITRVTKVIDPTTGAAVAVPDDLIAWLASHPKLSAGTAEAVTIAGVSGQWVDVTASDAREHALFAYPTGNMRLPVEVMYRVHVLPLDGADLTIVVGAPAAKLAQVTDAVQPVLDSLVIDSGG